MKKILIIRTAPLAQYVRVWEKLRQDYPECDITVVTQMSTTAAVLDSAPVRLVNYATTTILPWSFSLDEIKRLRARHFDSVVILYTNHLGQGYFWVRLFAYLLGSAEIYALDRSGRRYELSLKKELNEFVRYRLAFVVYGAIWFGLWVGRWIDTVGSRQLAVGGRSKSRQ